MIDRGMTHSCGFKLMGDQELRDAVARLERTVTSLSQAEGEVGRRIADRYRESLDAAATELARRRQI